MRTPIRRVIISKRKQTAVERRTGRELLREHDLLKMATVNKTEQYSVRLIPMRRVANALIVCCMALLLVAAAHKKAA